MLCLTLVGIVAIVPTMSMPTRTDSADDNEYRVTLYREGSRQHPGERGLDAIDVSNPDQSWDYLSSLPQMQHQNRPDDDDDINAPQTPEELSDEIPVLKLLVERTVDRLGGGHLLTGRSMDRIGGGHLLGGRNMDRIGGGHLLGGRAMDRIGGGHLLGGRTMDRIGGGHLLGGRTMDRIGGGHLLGGRAMDRIGGGHLLGGRTMDRLGGGHLLSGRAYAKYFY